MTKLRNKLKYATLTMLASTAISAKVDAKSDENTSSEKFSKVEHGVIGNTTIEKIFTSFSDDRIYKEYDYFKSTKDLGNGYSVVSTESNISENSENKVNSSLYLVGKDGSVVDISGINNFDDELHKARHNPKKEDFFRLSRSAIRQRRRGMPRSGNRSLHHLDKSRTDTDWVYFA